MKLVSQGHPDLDLSSMQIMGILNVTPDSFSDGGLYRDVEQAVSHGLAMARDGATVIDVGGESTRPGSQRVSVDEQIQRTEPVIRKLRQALDQAHFNDVWISIDTTRQAVAEKAAKAGAALVNDVSAGLDDEAMLPWVGERGLAIALMHKLGEPADMQDNPTYDDVVREVTEFLSQRVACAIAAGVGQSSIVLDPGIGFGKTQDHNTALLANIDQLVATGWPILVGASRKRWIEAIDGIKSMPQQRDAGSLAIMLAMAQSGVQLIRQHDVRGSQQSLKIWQTIKGSNC